MSRILLLGAASNRVTVLEPGPSSDHTLIQTAIDNMTALGGGVVALAGSFDIDAPLVVKDGVTLTGYGPRASVINLMPGSNCDMVTIANLAMFWEISNLTLDGHWESNTSGRGIVLNTTDKPNVGVFAFCTWSLMDKVLVQYTASDGYYIADNASVESRFTNLYAYNCKGRGFNIAGGSDRFFANLTSGQSGLEGILWGPSLGDRLLGAKVWFAGRCAITRDVAPIQAGNGVTPGVEFSGVQNFQVSGMESQDCTGPGFKVASSSGHLQLHSDHNGVGMVDPIGMHLQFSDAAWIDLSIGTGSSHGSPVTAYPLKIEASAVDCRVDVMAESGGCLNPNSLAPGSTNDPSNVIRFNA